MSSPVCPASSAPEQVLGDADLVGLVGASPECYGDPGLATRAAHSMCLTSASVHAAVLASVQRMRMDAPLPVLQQMASLVSLHVSGPGQPLDPSQLPRLTRLQADGISSPQVMSAIMQLTRLQELRLDINAEDGEDMQCALQCISRLSSLGSLGITFAKMERIPDAIYQLTALTSLHLGKCRIQQLPDAISQLASLSSLDLYSCFMLHQLPDAIGQLTALSSLNLGCCGGFKLLPGAIGQLPALSSLDLSCCGNLQQLPDTISQPSGAWI
jgi:hypothetical protein